MPSPATQPSIKITKSFLYRGSTQLFSNRYYLSAATPPASNAAWTTLADAIVTAEKAIYSTDVTIVAATGYDAGSDLPIFSKTYSTAGTYVATGGHRMPGDCAALVRYTTTQRTSKNHPVYLFNYYHGVYRADAATAAQYDDLQAGQSTAMTTYATAWVAGFSDGTVTYKKAGPRGAVAQSGSAQPKITHRDFLR